MELDLRDYVAVIRRRIVLIVSIVVAATLVTGIASYFFIKPTYEASSELIVNTNKEVQGTGQFDLNSVNLNIRLIDTYKEIIRTVRIMDIVAEQYPELGLSSAQLVNKVRVSSVNNTQVMTLSVQDGSHERAVEIVNAISTVFAQEIPAIMNMTVDNVSILAKAQNEANPVPIKPNKMLNIAISLVVSMMLALGLAFLLEYMDDTIKTEKEIEEELGLPTLVMIRKIGADELKKTIPFEETKKQAGEMSRVTINR